MNIALAIGGFFLVLAVLFALAARRDDVGSGREATAAGKTRRRVAWVFAVVGLGLILWALIAQ